MLEKFFKEQKRCNKFLPTLKMVHTILGFLDLLQFKPRALFKYHIKIQYINFYENRIVVKISLEVETIL